MFLQTLRKFTHTLSTRKHLQIRLCSTGFEPHESPAVKPYDKVINDITVTGEVIHSYCNENKAVTFYIKSIYPGKFVKTHKVFVTNRHPLFDMLKTNLESNQKVYIEGKLSTSRFVTADGKHRSQSAIWATDIRILSHIGVAKGLEDENLVELTGIITTDCSGSNFRSFTLATPIIRESSKLNSNMLCYNRIFAYDDSLFPLLENLRIRKDKLLVRGEISYRKNTDKHGKEVASSYIVAKQIYRI